jgi:NAD(P)H-nitrite reductase large subunit
VIDFIAARLVMDDQCRRLLIITAGGRPDAAIARETGIDLGETGGIVTDEMMRTNIPDIYAAGGYRHRRRPAFQSKKHILQYEHVPPHKMTRFSRNLAR